MDRGQRLLIGLPTALLLVACSRGLPGGGEPGTGGTPGTGQGGDGTGGNPGTGQGGGAGTAFGGTGGVGGTGGIGGTVGRGGSGGTFGSGGAPVAPTCPAGMATFSVCVVNDADMVPFPSGAGGGPQHDLITAAAATVEAVGTGAAPAQCQSARLFGAAVSSDWWLQIRTADTKLWTIGVGGLGDAVMFKTGDSVTLDLTYQFTPSDGSPIIRPATSGFVQLKNSAGTPLLWAGSNSYSATWLSFVNGQALCNQKTGLCPNTRYEVMATINGSAATLQPFSATNLGGYYLAVGEYAVVTSVIHTECAFMGPPAFVAAAIKTP